MCWKRRGRENLKIYNTKVTEETIGDLDCVEYTVGSECGTANRIWDLGFEIRDNLFINLRYGCRYFADTTLLQVE